MKKATNNDYSFLADPVPKGSVVKMVISRIREAIEDGELNPGDILPSESEFARRLSVGKTSVREAIKSLEAMGVVQVRQGYGTVIRDDPGADAISPLIFRLLLEKGTTDELLVMREVIEPAYTVLAMQNATKEDEQKLKEQVQEFEEKVQQGTQTAEDDLEFHRLILDCTHNPYLRRIGNTILQLFEPSIQESARTIPETAVRDHKRILEAFLEKDEEKLRKAILDSFAGSKMSLDRQAAQRRNKKGPTATNTDD